MTNEEWETVRKAVEEHPNRARLKADGYQIDIYLLPVDPYHNEIVVYVENKFDPKWLDGKGDGEGKEICRRFFCPSTKSFVKKPRQKLSKKEQRLFEEEKKRRSVTTYSPFWKNFKSLKAHLIKNNSSIEIAEV